MSVIEALVSPISYLQKPSRDLINLIRNRDRTPTVAELKIKTHQIMQKYLPGLKAIETFSSIMIMVSLISCVVFKSLILKCLSIMTLIC